MDGQVDTSVQTTHTMIANSLLILFALLNIFVTPIVGFITPMEYIVRGF